MARRASHGTGSNGRLGFRAERPAVVVKGTFEQVDRFVWPSGYGGGGREISAGRREGSFKGHS